MAGDYQVFRESPHGHVHFAKRRNLPAILKIRCQRWNWAGCQSRNNVRSLSFVNTLKHSSWLNIAECEFSCVGSHRVAERRIGELVVLQSRISTLLQRANAKQRGVDWQFQADDARSKLKKLYS